MTKEMTKNAEEYEKNVSHLKRQVAEINERRQTENEKKVRSEFYSLCFWAIFHCFYSLSSKT